MSVDEATLLAILGMAAATYLTRAGGYFLVRRLPPGRFVEAWLRHIPGAMFVALVTPAVANGGPAAWAGAAAVLAAARLWGNLVVSLLAGVGAVYLVRLALP